MMDIERLPCMPTDVEIKLIRDIHEQLDSDRLKPIKDKLDNSLSPNVRAIAFNIFDRLGTLLIGEFASFIKKIETDDKLIISKLVIRIGAKFFFTPSFLKKSSMEICAILWKVYNNFSKAAFVSPLCHKASPKLVNTFGSLLLIDKDFSKYSIASSNEPLVLRPAAKLK